MCIASTVAEVIGCSIIESYHGMLPHAFHGLKIEAIWIEKELTPADFQPILLAIPIIPFTSPMSHLLPLKQLKNFVCYTS